jgi:predicted phage tail component-like protein
VISFKWKNKDSFLDFGILIKEKPPIYKAERNIDEIEIPGRDGNLTIDYSTHKAIVFTMECTLIDSNNIDNIKVWLEGFDKLIFSWENDRYYNAKCVNQIDIAQSFEIFGDFPIIFKAQPFAYSLNDSLITLLSSGIINNPGTKYSNPIVKIYGNGAVDLTINNTAIHLDNVDGYITIDSELVDCYKDTVLMNNYMSGDFPILVPGDNSINWSGAVTKIEIIPNWRWL